jgi:dipeptidyl aminopeptidase/acylaminoacyl peptidase
VAPALTGGFPPWTPGGISRNPADVSLGPANANRTPMTTLRLPTLLSLCALLLAPLVSNAASPPAEFFARRDQVSDTRISESGRYVSYLTPAKDQFFDLNLHDLQTKDTWKINLGGYEVFRYEWVDDTRLIMQYGNGSIQVYDAATNKITGTIRPPGIYLQFISSLRRDPDLFVCRYYEEESNAGNRTGLGIVNIKLHGMLMAGANNRRYNVKEWIDLPKGEHHHTLVDKEGEVRLLTVYRDKRFQYFYRTSPAASWQELPFDHETTTIIGFADDTDYIYVAHYADDAHSSRLHRYQVSTKEFGAPLFEDPDYSMSEAWLTQVRQPDGKTRVLALSYQRDVFVQRAIDPVFAEVQRTVNAKLPGRQNHIQDCDHAVNRFIIGSQSGREPVRYVIYDRAADTFSPLPAPAPWFNAAEMSVKRPIKFTTRDGLVLEGYLSLPVPSATGAKPPLVVHPHGGPWVRDTWGFDANVQFLTTRGYAVFQPNYRGSAGYSRAVSKTDEWDFRKMHDDVTDGVRHLVQSGVIDDQRIAIFGGSFGGYLALAGAAFEPGLYRCAVTFAGVFDWEQLVRQSRVNRRYNEFAYDQLLKKLGDPKKQQERFEGMSPIAHVAAIKAPVLVVHGKLDSTVDYRQSTKLLSELKEHRIPHERLFFETEYHGFTERKNRQKFLETVERFLAKNL